MHWNVVGHEDQKSYLERLLDEGRLPHALLLAGPEGIGKRMVAGDIVSSLVAAGNSLDIMRLAPIRDEETGKRTNIPIESVRDMKHWLSLRPLGKHKAVIVDDADRLGHDAANTLLKLLEEPPLYARMILVSGRPQDVLATIASRCERVDFRPLGDDHMDVALKDEKLDGDQRALLTTVACGRPGIALQLIRDGKLPTVARHIAALEKVLKAGITDRILYAKEVAEDDDVSEIVAWWLSYIHTQLPVRPVLATAAHGLVDLYRTVSEPAYNRRLAVEHFLLAL